MATFQQIEIFLAVTTEGSFRGAAARLGLVQSVVSTHVQALEHWLGFTLFAQGRRAGALSIEGEEAFLRAQRVQQHLADLTRFLDAAAAHRAQPRPARPTLKQIETLAWLSKLGTLERAAGKLNITPAAAGRRIGELARQCAFPLFASQRVKSRLSAQGDRLVEHSLRLLAAHDELILLRTPARRDGAILRLGVTELVALTWFPAFVRRMRAAHPQVSLHPDVDLAVSLRAKLADGRLDVALLPRGEVDARFATVDVGTVGFSWFCAPGQFETGRKATLYALAQCPLLVQGRDSGITTVTEALFAEAGLQPRQIFGSNSLVALAGLIESGIGISCLPKELFSDLIEKGRLAVIKTTTAPPRATYCAMFPHDHRTALCQAVAAVARESSSFSKGSAVPS